MAAPDDRDIRATAGPARGIAARLSVYYGCLCFGYGVTMPYLNPWLASRGLSIADIALLASVMAITRIVAGPVVGVLADRWQAHRQALVLLTWGSVVAWLLLGQATQFWHFFVVQVLIAATGAALMPLGETLAVAASRTHGVDYGRVRLWGSWTFILATLIGGVLVDGLGIRIAIVMLTIAAVATAASTALLAKPETPNRRGGVRFGEALALMRSPALLLFLLVVALAQSSHATLYVFSTLHWQRLGLSTTWCGLLWTIGVIAEIAVFWFAPALQRLTTPLRLIGLGLGAGVVRWTFMGFDPTLAMLMPLQILHGLTYGAAHLGAMQYLSRKIAPELSGTVQSLYAVVTGGIGFAIATQVAGAAYLAAGGRAYWAMAAFSLAGLVALAVLHRRAP